MSLHTTLKNTWYMRLKQQRDERDVAPSMFAHRIPAIEKTADSVASKKHQPELAPSDLKTASMTDGDYIKSEVGTHKNSYTAKERNQIINSFMVDSSESSVDDMESEGMPTLETEPDDFVRPHLQTIREVDDALKLLDTKDVGKPSVYNPINDLYNQLGVGIVLDPERKGAGIVIMGQKLSKFEDLEQLKQIKTKLLAIGKQLTRNTKANKKKNQQAIKHLAFSRINSDAGKIESRIKALEKTHSTDLQALD